MDLLFDVYVEVLLKLKHEVDSFLKEHLEKCIDEFVELKSRKEITYDDLEDDLHVYFAEFLSQDSERCPDLRYIWERDAVSPVAEQQYNNHADL